MQQGIDQWFLARIHRRDFVCGLTDAAGLDDGVVHVEVAGRAG